MFLSLIVAAVPPVGAPTQAFAGDVVTNPGNFSLQLTADPNPAYEGDTVTWTVTVKNLRTSGARPTLTWRPGTAGAWGRAAGGWTNQSGPSLALPGGSTCELTPVVEAGGWGMRPRYDGNTYAYWLTLASNASGRFTCTSEAPSPGSYQASVTMNARFGATNYGQSETSWVSRLTATETLVVSPPPGPDLALTKTASSPTVASGSDVTFALRVANTGAASGPFTVTDTLPAGLTVKAPLPAGCTSTGQTVTCNNTGLASGGNVTYNIVATAGMTPGAVNNTATVKLDSGEADTNPANDSSSAQVTIQTADLTVSKTATPHHRRRGPAGDVRDHGA